MSAETTSSSEPVSTDLATQLASVMNERDTILDFNRQLVIKLGEMQKFVDAAAEEKKAVGQQLEGMSAKLRERDMAASALDQERAAHELVVSELAGARLEQESLKLQLNHAVEKSAASGSELILLKNQFAAAETARQQLQSRLGDAEREVDSLRNERDALKTEMASLVEQRSSHRDFARKFAEAEHQIAVILEERRVIAAELERVRITEQELNEGLAESTRLVEWLHARIQKPKAAPQPEVRKVVPVHNDSTVNEAVARCRHAVDRSAYSPVEGLRELDVEVSGLNMLTQAKTAHRSLHRFGHTLGLFAQEMCGAPRMLRPSGLLTVRRAVEVLELMSQRDDPPFPTASAIVVDRDPQEIQMVIEAMKSVEFQLFCADESRPALETLAGEHHDLILLDWQGSASILDVQHIRTMPRHQQTPIIFLANAESEEPARLVGDDVLIKPLIALEIALKVLTLALAAQLSNEASGV